MEPACIILSIREVKLGSNFYSDSSHKKIDIGYDLAALSTSDCNVHPRTGREGPKRE